MKARGMIVIFSFIYILFILLLFNTCSVKFANIVIGYNFQPINFNIYLVFLMFLALLPSFIIPIKNNVGSIFLLLFYLSSIIPMFITLPFLLDMNERDLNAIIVWPIFNLIIFLLFIIIYRKSGTLNVKIKILVGRFYSFINLFYFLIATIVLLIIIKTFGFSFHLINIMDVYEVRSQYKEAIGGNRLIGYIVINAGYILSPFLLLLGYKEKNILLKLVFIFIALTISLVIFNNTGFKSIAFSWIVVILFYYILNKKKPHNITLFFLKSIVYVFLFAYVLYLLGGFYEVPFIHWLRRVFLESGINNNYYFDYFQKYSFTSGNVANLISKYYYSTDGSANTNFIGDYFLRYSYGGIIIGYMILFIILLIFKVLENKFKDIYFLIALNIPIIYAFNFTAITSLFLSYGLFFEWFLIYLFILKEKRHAKKNSKLSI